MKLPSDFGDYISDQLGYAVAIGTVLGMLLSRLLTYMASSRKVKVDEFTAVQNKWDSMYKTLEKQNKEFKDTIAVLELNYSELKQSFEVYKHIQNDLPFPQWIKDHSGRVLAINDAYEHHFLSKMGKSKNDYLMKRDQDIWGDEISKMFEEYDQKAFYSSEVIIADTKLDQISDVKSEILKGWVFYKYVVKLEGRKIPVAIGGIAIPVDDEKYMPVTP